MDIRASDMQIMLTVLNTIILLVFGIKTYRLNRSKIKDDIHQNKISNKGEKQLLHDEIMDLSFSGLWTNDIIIEERTGSGKTEFREINYSDFEKLLKKAEKSAKVEFNTLLSEKVSDLVKSIQALHLAQFVLSDFVEKEENKGNKDAVFSKNGWLLVIRRETCKKEIEHLRDDFSNEFYKWMRPPN